MPNLLLRSNAGRGILDSNVGIVASKSCRGLLRMDLNVNSFRIVQQLTTENKEDKKTQAGRAGGKVGGPARANRLTPERRKEIAKKANKARWKTD